MEEIITKPEDIKLRQGEFFIVFNNGSKYYKMKQKGKIFSYKGMKFGLQGSKEEGYVLTHIASGMLAWAEIYKRLNDFRKDIEEIYSYINSFPKKDLIKAKEILKNAKEVKEEKNNDKVSNKN